MPIDINIDDYAFEQSDDESMKAVEVFKDGEIRSEKVFNIDPNYIFDDYGNDLRPDSEKVQLINVENYSATGKDTNKRNTNNRNEVIIPETKDKLSIFDEIKMINPITWLCLLSGACLACVHVVNIIFTGNYLSCRFKYTPTEAGVVMGRHEIFETFSKIGITI